MRRTFYFISLIYLLTSQCVGTANHQCNHLVLNYTIFVAQELKNNLNEYPNLQNVFDEYFYDVFECNKIIDNIRNEKEDLAQQVSCPNLLI